MGWYILLGALAAYGALSVIWTVLGWFLPGLDGCVLVCAGLPDEGTRSRYRWLRGTGLLRCPLLALSEETGLCGAETEICSRDELIARLEWERDRRDGTGNGDHSGRDQRRGLSEL